MLSYLDSRGSHNVWRVKVKTWWGVKGQTITGEVPTFTISSRASGGFRASIKAPQQWLVGFGWIISFLICIVSDLVLLPAAFTVRLKQPVWDDLMFRYMCAAGTDGGSSRLPAVNTHNLWYLTSLWGTAAICTHWQLEALHTQIHTESKGKTSHSVLAKHYENKS